MESQNESVEVKNPANVRYIKSFKGLKENRRSDISFSKLTDLMCLNRKNQERLRKERNDANLSVIKSYKLKKKEEYLKTRR